MYPKTPCFLAYPVYASLLDLIGTALLWAALSLMMALDMHPRSPRESLFLICVP